MKRVELFRDDFREEIGLPMSDTGTQSGCETGSPSCKKNGGPAMGNDFEGNKKIFWKEVKRVRKGEQAREEMVKDVSGQILRDGVEVGEKEMGRVF